MATREPILLLGPLDRTRLLAGRLGLLDFRGLRATDPSAARQTLIGAGPAVHVGILATDHELKDLRDVLVDLDRHAPAAPLRWIACGPPPEPSERAALREAGVAFGLFEPFTDEELRFVVNEASHAHTARAVPRHEHRVPADLRAHVTSAAGEKVAVIYNLSTSGAYLVTPRPTLRGGTVQLRFQLPTGEIAVTGHVIWNNVPGNLRRSNAPVGMGVGFEAPPPEAQARLLEYVESRAQAYGL